MSSDKLVRPALGETVPLGTLYDARTDTFLPNLFLEDLPENFVNVKLNTKLTAQLSKATTIRDKLSTLGITRELGASVLAGLVTTNIYAQYLNNWNGYQRTAAQASLLYTITTGEEEIKEYATSNRTYRIPDMMDKPTHLVTGITWGAQFLVVARRAASIPDDLLRQQERLDSVFQSIKNTALNSSSQSSGSSNSHGSDKQ